MQSTHSMYMYNFSSSNWFLFLFHIFLLRFCTFCLFFFLLIAKEFFAIFCLCFRLLERKLSSMHSNYIHKTTLNWQFDGIIIFFIYTYINCILNYKVLKEQHRSINKLHYNTSICSRLIYDLLYFSSFYEYTYIFIYVSQEKH